jgi:hypothetical protein
LQDKFKITPYDKNILKLFLSETTKALTADWPMTINVELGSIDLLIYEIFLHFLIWSYAKAAVVAILDFLLTQKEVKR